MINLAEIGTEQGNARTVNIDQCSTLEMVQLMNQEDQAVIGAVNQAAPEIASAIDLIVAGIKSGGRLIYMGAGTSGRLGVLDASECLPTFGVGEEMVMGMIAGGDQALRHPVENAEDNFEAGRADLEAIDLSERDIVCAIAASGRTPYCLGALNYAEKLGAKRIALVCVKQSPMREHADITIEAVVGPEVITGSTRLKSGSAQKMILNMLSTGSMIHLGKVYGNQMVDLRATNEKLVARAKRILQQVTGCSAQEAEALLEKSGGSVKPAIVMAHLNLSYEAAMLRLAQYDGHIRHLFTAERER